MPEQAPVIVAPSAVEFGGGVASVNRGRASLMLSQGEQGYPRGSREMHVFDPDGHVLRFGSDLRDGEPMGEWLDEKGGHWIPQPDGNWRAK